MTLWTEGGFRRKNSVRAGMSMGGRRPGPGRRGRGGGRGVWELKHLELSQCLVWLCVAEVEVAQEGLP